MVLPKQLVARHAERFLKDSGLHSWVVDAISPPIGVPRTGPRDTAVLKACEGTILPSSSRAGKGGVVVRLNLSKGLRNFAAQMELEEGFPGITSEKGTSVHHSDYGSVSVRYVIPPETTHANPTRKVEHLLLVFDKAKFVSALRKVKL